MWKKRITETRSGLFEPLSDKYETITVPGANGGAIVGNTAANPKKGLVFVSTMDKPAVYKLKKLEPVQLTDPLSANETEFAKAFYTQSCQSCHGANYAGAVGPSLVNVNTRLSFDNFKSTVNDGRGQMPAFIHLDEQAIISVYKLLSGTTGQRAGGNARNWYDPRPASQSKTMVAGPVVAHGGAPGEAAVAKVPLKPMTDYPEGVARPKNRYADGSQFSWGGGFSNLIGPPWTSIVCYDLNTGQIKWKRPLGNDEKIAPGQNLGIPGGSQNKGMIVTATGIVFATCGDGNIYAYDEDNGNLLWKYKFPRVPEGLPAMYEVNGRQYMVVCSVAAKVTDGPDNLAPRAYYVFALPKKK